VVDNHYNPISLNTKLKAIPCVLFYLNNIAKSFLFTNQMEKFIFMFLKPEGLVFELVVDEGDNVYWASRSGTMLSQEKIVNMLNEQESVIASLPVIGSEW
jgi:hypothetical protein